MHEWIPKKLREKSSNRSLYCCFHGYIGNDFSHSNKATALEMRKEKEKESENCILTREIKKFRIPSDAENALTMSENNY